MIFDHTLQRIIAPDLKWQNVIIKIKEAYVSYQVAYQVRSLSSGSWNLSSLDTKTIKRYKVEIGIFELIGVNHISAYGNSLQSPVEPKGVARGKGGNLISPTP